MFIHLFIFFVDFQESSCNAILEAYVEALIKEKQHDLVAFYVAKLPHNAQVHWYAIFLESKLEIGQFTQNVPSCLCTARACTSDVGWVIPKTLLVLVTYPGNTII